MVDRTRQRRRIRIGLALGLVAGTAWAALEERPERGPAQAATVAALPPPAIITVAPGEPRPSTSRDDGAIAAAPEPEPERWAIPAGAIDPRRATLIDGRLGQVLEDGTLIGFTLDPHLQAVAQRTLERYAVTWGAIVAVRPKTGEILAFAEHAEGRPDLSRLPLHAGAPAASIFKVVSAAALLEYGQLTPGSEICTHGGQQKLTLYHLKANERLDTRCETFAQALGSSNNVAFARWADDKLAPLQLQAMANRFLFGKRIPFPWAVGVSRARVPTGSRLGLARTAAGFENTTLSPLHAALITAAIANDGVMMAPQLVATADRAGERVFEAEPAVLAEILTPAVAGDLREMLAASVSYGTGKKFFEKKGKPRLPVRAGGKSGSLSGSEDGVKRHYSWFVAFAPVEEPEIAVAALVVNGDEWTIKGAVAARDLLEAHYDRGAPDPAERDPLSP